MILGKKTTKNSNILSVQFAVFNSFLLRIYFKKFYKPIGQLNMTEDSILGYDLYSSALSEILSEPSLHLPITVGLYAKWGSGKSFLLSQLKNEMKSFARLTKVIKLDFNLFLVLAITLSILTITSPFFFWEWFYGLILFGSFLVVSCAIIGIIFNSILF